MTTEKSKLIERIFENYALGRISRKQMDAMIKVVDEKKAYRRSDVERMKPACVTYMRVGNENQLK